MDVVSVAVTADAEAIVVMGVAVDAVAAETVVVAPAVAATRTKRFSHPEAHSVAQGAPFLSISSGICGRGAICAKSHGVHKTAYNTLHINGRVYIRRCGCYGLGEQRAPMT